MVCLILSSSVDTMTSNHEDNFSFRQISAFFFLESDCGEGADADSEETIIHALIQYDTHESKSQTGYFLFKSQILILEIKPDRKSRLVLHQIMFYLTFKLKKKNTKITNLFYRSSGIFVLQCALCRPYTTTVSRRAYPI